MYEERRDEGEQDCKDSFCTLCSTETINKRGKEKNKQRSLTQTSDDDSRTRKGLDESRTRQKNRRKETFAFRKFRKD